jgi:hypothetical protein
VLVHKCERLRARSQERTLCGAKPIERDDPYRSNVAPYRSLVILTLIKVKIYGWSRELSRNVKRTNVKNLRVIAAPKVPFINP